MAKQRVFLTGATGMMGAFCVRELLKDSSSLSLVILVLPADEKSKNLKPYKNHENVEIIWGDLTNYADVKHCVEGADIVLHVGALVSPIADYNPELAMRINYGSIVNIVTAVKELEQEEQTRVVAIGTIAETGDRMPPIHWGRVGDPIKPSVFDYYAVSKVAAERYLIESGLPYWVSLRQTGIMGQQMKGMTDAIVFHNCLDNVLEYVSDRDSAFMLRNLCAKERAQVLGEEFWGHIFNIGGGVDCRASTTELYSHAFSKVGIHGLEDVSSSKWYATRNFHGQFYLDSDKLNNLLDFQRDTIEYCYESILAVFGPLAGFAEFIARFSPGKKLVSAVMRRIFKKAVHSEHGTLRFIQDDMQGHIAAYWGSREAWEAIPPMNEFKHFTDWTTVVHIDHGYDEKKPQDELCLADVQQAARFRGGTCLSSQMQTGNWVSKLQFCCGFGHTFDASPRLILEGGHWCPVCERESWNYYERAKIDAFFAQVWTPLHPADEKPWCYPKVVSELDVVLT